MQTPADKPKSPWFHPQTLLDKTYEIGIIIKGIDGVLELVGGLLILLLSPATINSLTRFLTENELAKDPHDFVSTHILHYGNELATGHTGFAALFLLTHGIVKVALVTALLLQRFWAYPWALVALTLFLVYQLYLMVVQPTYAMAFLTVLDAAIIWLVWREWQKVKRDHVHASQP